MRVTSVGVKDGDRFLVLAVDEHDDQIQPLPGELGEAFNQATVLRVIRQRESVPSRGTGSRCTSSPRAARK